MADIKNVLLIVVDQWRGDTLGHIGHACIRTPAIDALGRDGVTFRNHYTQCAPCGPARTCLMLLSQRSCAEAAEIVLSLRSSARR